MQGSCDSIPIRCFIEFSLFPQIFLEFSQGKGADLWKPQSTWLSRIGLGLKTAATLQSITQTSESVWVEASGYLPLPDRSQIYPLQGTFSGTSQKPSSLLSFLIYRENFKYLSLVKPLYYINVFHKLYNTFTTRRFSPFYNTYNQVLCIAQH